MQLGNAVPVAAVFARQGWDRQCLHLFSAMKKKQGFRTRLFIRSSTGRIVDGDAEKISCRQRGILQNQDGAIDIRVSAAQVVDV